MFFQWYCRGFYVVVLSRFVLLGTKHTTIISTPPPHVLTNCMCISSSNSFCLLHSTILSNCKVIGALNPPIVEIYTHPLNPETPQAFQHLFLIPEITPLATTWGPHACHFEPH